MRWLTPLVVQIWTCNGSWNLRNDIGRVTLLWNVSFQALCTKVLIEGPEIMKGFSQKLALPVFLSIRERRSRYVGENQEKCSELQKTLE